MCLKHLDPEKLILELRYKGLSVKCSWGCGAEGGVFPSSSYFSWEGRENSVAFMPDTSNFLDEIEARTILVVGCGLHCIWADRSGLAVFNQSNHRLLSLNGNQTRYFKQRGLKTENWVQRWWKVERAKRASRGNPNICNYRKQLWVKGYGNKREEKGPRRGQKRPPRTCWCSELGEGVAGWCWYF